MRAKLVGDLPTVVIDRAPLALDLSRLGQLYWDTGRWHEAEVTLLRGVRLCESVFGSPDADSRLARERIGFLERLGRLYADASRSSESAEYLKKAVAAQKNSADKSATAAEDRERLVTLLIRLATADRRHTLPKRPWTEGLSRRQLRVDFPSNEHYSGLVATVLEQLAELPQVRHGAAIPSPRPAGPHRRHP